MPNTDRLLALLADGLAPWRQAPGWRLAFSGGLDSTVLLHLLVRLGRQQPLPPLSAIHVHHGLQPQAEDWARHCAAICAAWQVPLSLERVQVVPGQGLEAAARTARYDAFARLLGKDELLLMAHHQNDQAETLLFRLLRGAGVRGLAAIPPWRRFTDGSLVRPLLGVSRQQLIDYAQAQGLHWVEDPSNQDQAYARNLIRQRILPAIEAAWPQARVQLAGTASRLREAQGLLEELAGQDLAVASTPSPWPWLTVPSLALAPLAALSPARQRNALRCWLAPYSSLPNEAHWAGWQALRDASPETAPQWHLAAGVLQRGAGRIWWLSGDWLSQPPAPVAWPDPGTTLPLPGNGRLSLSGAGVPGPLQVRYRQGGEQLMIVGRGHRDLKRLLNEAGLPAFVRGRLPLIYQGEQLLAVANLPRLAQRQGLAFAWQPPAASVF